MAEMAPKLSTLKPMKVMKKPAAMKKVVKKIEVTFKQGGLSGAAVGYTTAVVDGRDEAVSGVKGSAFGIDKDQTLESFVFGAILSVTVDEDAHEHEYIHATMKKCGVYIDGVGSYDLSVDGNLTFDESWGVKEKIEVILPLDFIVPDTEAEPAPARTFQQEATHSMPPKGDVPKTELAESIAEIVGMNTVYIADLAKANRDGLIALRNCIVHQVDKLEKAEAEIAELKASITK